MKYSSEEHKHMLELKEEIVGTCEVCGGRGFTLDDGYDNSCDCQLVFRFIRKLVLAGISPEYWTLTYDDLLFADVYKNILSVYVRRLRAATQKGLGLFLIGENGIGKTLILSLIGMDAISKGYRVQYITQQRYLDWISPREVDKRRVELARLESAQIILFDELGKGYQKQDSLYVPAKIEEFLRRKLSEGVAVSACSNYELEHLEDMLGSSTLSVMERHLKFIKMEGLDRSPERQDNWLAELESSFDYFHPAIVDLARRMDANNEW